MISKKDRESLVKKVVADRISDYWDDPDEWQLTPDDWRENYIDEELLVINIPADLPDAEFDKRKEEIALFAFQIGIECRAEMDIRITIYNQRMAVLKSELSVPDCHMNPKFQDWNLLQDSRGYWQARRRIKGTAKIESRYIGKDISRAGKILG